MHLKACFSRISPGADCGGCLRNGASPIPAITFFIRAGGSPQLRFPWWSTRCDTGIDTTTTPWPPEGATSEIWHMLTIRVLRERHDGAPKLDGHQRQRFAPSSWGAL